jgi:hypothetical protein
MPYRLAVRDISFFERPVTFARPFRFGRGRHQRDAAGFVRVEIEVEGKGRATGASAEFLVPKWFDKRPHLSPEETVTELRRSLLIARELYLAHSGFETAFGLHAACIGAQIEACAREDIRRWRRLTAGRNRQGDPGCAAALYADSISLTAWRPISPASMRACRAI